MFISKKKIVMDKQFRVKALLEVRRDTPLPKVTNVFVKIQTIYQKVT